MFHTSAGAHVAHNATNVLDVCVCKAMDVNGAVELNVSTERDKSVVFCDNASYATDCGVNGVVVVVGFLQLLDEDVSVDVAILN